MKTSFLVMEWNHNKITQSPYLEVIGIFSTKEKAIKECLTDHHFWGEFEVDKAQHEKGVGWPTKEAYPIKQNA